MERVRCLLHRLGGSIDAILRENYESVVAMQNLIEALERIDSSFQFMLVAREMRDANERGQVWRRRPSTSTAENWGRFDEALNKERNNVTIHPTEDELVSELTAATKAYRRLGDEFFARRVEVESGMKTTTAKAGCTTSFSELRVPRAKSWTSTRTKCD